MDPSSTNIRFNGSLVYLKANTGEWFYFDTREKPLGSGAMGTVYYGRSCTNHRRLVAIKCVLERLASNPKIRKRAKEEASFAFRHPNMVEMLGYCEEGPDWGRIFIISNLVQGITLDKHVLQNLNGMPDRVNRIVRCALPVLDALSYLHAKKILHLDIKPTNIMVENDRNIRLMDLGIATVSSVINPSKGGLLGTPGYAAPEQYVSEGQTELDVSNATDIYELAATLYDLLSGKKPYGDSSSSLRPIKGVSHPLNAVLRTALSKDQKQRYQSAAEFRQALVKAMNAKSMPIWACCLLVGLAIAIVSVLFVFMFS